MAVASTGFFDGVHLGHRQVLKTLVGIARQRSEKSVVVTFWPHPRIVLGQDAGSLNLLTPLDRKIELIKSLGVDEVKVLEFDKEFSLLTAEQYIRDVLQARFDVDALVLGYDSRLGHDKLDPEQIRELAEPMGVDVTVTPPVCDPSRPISSTRIRKLLEQGDISGANALLGYDYY